MFSNLVNRFSSSSNQTSNDPKLIKFNKKSITSGSPLKKKSKTSIKKLDTKAKQTESVKLPQFIQTDENTKPSTVGDMNFGYPSDRLLNKPFESLNLNENQQNNSPLNLTTETFFFSSKLTPNGLNQEVDLKIDKLSIEHEHRKVARFADEPEYRMNHPRRGYAVIINNKRFDSRLDMPVRDGTDVDAASLESTLKKLGFETKIFHNCSASLIRDLMLRYAKSDHSDADCFMSVFMSHGEDGVIYGIDKEIEIEKLIHPFKLNRSLAGKPKIFLIQACRGNQLMEGIDSNPYDIQYVNKVPIEADFLIAYSTISGYFSWRNSLNGSWFIQSLCHVLNECGKTAEIMQILTAVNRRVAYHYESNTNDPTMNGKKQIPCIVSMLTKELYFRQKHNSLSIGMSYS